MRTYELPNGVTLFVGKELRTYELPNGDVVCRDDKMQLLGIIQKMSTWQSPRYKLSVDGEQSLSGDSIEAIVSVLRASLNPEPLPEPLAPDARAAARAVLAERRAEFEKTVENSKGKKRAAK